MANHCYLCPTKNKIIFYTPEKLLSFLKEKVKGYKYELKKIDNTFGWIGDNSISIFDEKDNNIINLWLYNNSNSDNKEMIDFADTKKGEDLGDEVIKYLDKCELDKCIEIRHNISRWSEEKDIIRKIQYHFGAIWIDEGIYPEVILPPKTLTESETKKKSLIKKFKDYIRIR